MGSPGAGHSKFGEPQVSSSEGVSPDDRLVPVGAHRHENDLDARDLFEPADVLLGGLRQVAELPGRRDVLLPPIERLVDRLRRLEPGPRERGPPPPGAVELISNTTLHAP